MKPVGRVYSPGYGGFPSGFEKIQRETRSNPVNPFSLPGSRVPEELDWSQKPHIKNLNDLHIQGFDESEKIPPALEQVVLYVKAMTLDYSYTRRNVHVIRAIVKRSTSVVRYLKGRFEDHLKKLEAPEETKMQDSDTGSTSSSDSQESNPVGSFFDDLNSLSHLERTLAEASALIRTESRYTCPNKEYIEIWSKNQAKLCELLSQLYESEPTAEVNAKVDNSWIRILDTCIWGEHLSRDVEGVGSTDDWGVDNEGFLRHDAPIPEGIPSPTLAAAILVASRITRLQRTPAFSSDDLSPTYEAISIFVWMVTSYTMSSSSIAFQDWSLLYQLLKMIP